MTAMPHNMGYCPENCFGCKAASVGFSASSMPTRKIAINDQDKFLATKEKDVAAYRRLRKDGLQPKTTSGSAALEATANSRWEVETGMKLGSAKLGEKYDAAQKAVTKGEVG